MSAGAVRQLDSGLTQPTPVEIPAVGESPSALVSASCYGWHGAFRLADLFGERDSAARMRLLRWIATLPEEQKRKPDGFWSIRGDAKLPVSSSGVGMTVAEFGQAVSMFKPPDGWAQYNEAQRRTWCLSAERERRFQTFLAEHGYLSKSDRETYEAFARGPDAEWLQVNKLSASKSTMYAAFDALVKRTEVPRRGRPKGAGKTIWHPQAAHLFDQLFYHSHANAADIWRTLCAFAAKERFAPPSLGMVRELIAMIPQGARVLARKGERALDAIAPKGRRPRKSVRGWRSLDCRIEDLFVQVPIAGGGVKHARPVCSGVLAPYSWQWHDLRFARTENKDLIAANIRAATLRYGLGRVYQTDNGKAYEWMTEAAGAFLEAFGAKAFRAMPYEGYAKPIESAWNSMKHGLDVWFRSFCGGCPAERPEDLERWAKANVHKLPTIADLNEWAAVFAETHNASPRKALGGLTPNLYAEAHGSDCLMVDADTIDIYFCPIVAERVCGPEGIQYESVLYRPTPEDLAKLQTRRVWVRLDGELADRIVLCQQDGTPICHAYKDQLAGATHEHRREARRQRQRYKRAVRAYIPARDDSLATETGRILRVKREHALAEERRLRAELGIEDQRGVRIVRPDLVESAKKLKSRERPRGTTGEVQAGPPAGTAGGAQAGAAAMDRERADGFERLAQRQEDAERVVVPTCSWADYPSEEPDDAAAQEADRSAFDRLADVG